MADYSGLKAGLEIHQQLNTNKLFCDCPSELRSDSPLFKAERELTPVIGETGKIDSAVIYEKNKNKKFIYEVYDTNCLVELDEEPPHDINKEALEIALQISLLLNCKIFSSSQVMRKTVIDGSNTSGFQRTVLIAHDGFIETTEGIVRIETIALEEDSARIVSQDKNTSTYRLDRLGIPLIEITTRPDLKTPEQIKESALKIGEILRACNVKRGIGTIRQDLNISTNGAERVEIKGFQDPKIMLKTIKLEIERQQKLIDIHKTLREKNASVSSEATELTDILRNTECKFIKNSIDSGSKVFGIKLENFKGIIGTGLSDKKRFGTELSDNAKTIGVGGIVHSDENLKKYNISSDEVKNIENALKINENDAFIFIVDESEKAIKAIDIVIKRARISIEKPSIKEVRKVNEDGTTNFLRPMPGEARMYPETDVKILTISKEKINDIKKNLPKLASENRSYLDEFGLNEELIKNILKQNKINEFKYLTKITNNHSLIAKALTIFPIEISKKLDEDIEKVNDKLTISTIEAILQAVESGKISDSDVRIVMQKIFQGEKIESAIRKEKIDLSSEIKTLIKSKPNLSSNAYMGLVMSKFRGKLNGKDVMNEINRILKSK